MQLILNSRLISEGNGTNESRFPQSPLHSVAMEVREEEVVGSGPIKDLKRKPAVSILSVVDRIGQEQHVLSGRAKDMGSAAVALSVLLLIVVWVLVLFG